MLSGSDTLFCETVVCKVSDMELKMISYIM
jgi:hypothetical protein